MKKVKPTCEHLDWNNERDCTEKSEYICICCSAPVCQEHKERHCPYGGEGYVELEVTPNERKGV